MAKAEIRIVFATNGENNPWPQRLAERKWTIKSSDRARWGERRRLEALNALLFRYYATIGQIPKLT